MKNLMYLLKVNLILILCLFYFYVSASYKSHVFISLSIWYLCVFGLEMRQAQPEYMISALKNQVKSQAQSKHFIYWQIEKRQKQQQLGIQETKV